MVVKLTNQANGTKGVQTQTNPIAKCFAGISWQMHGSNQVNLSPAKQSKAWDNKKEGNMSFRVYEIKVDHTSSILRMSSTCSFSSTWKGGSQVFFSNATSSKCSLFLRLDMVSDRALPTSPTLSSKNAAASVTSWSRQRRKQCSSR